MTRNPVKYPRLVHVHSSGHYPARYVQLTDEEFARFKVIADANRFEEVCGNRDWDETTGDRNVPRNEVDQLPKDIPEWCEYA